MLKKRIIFTLLYDNGNFMLSRNFRLQKVGDLAWLEKNYDFSHIAFYIDELVVLDVSRGVRDSEKFYSTLRSLTKGSFVPIAAGGGVCSVKDARNLLRSGADKIVVNSMIFENPFLIKELAMEFGQQCIVGSVDLRRNSTNDYVAYIFNGSRKIEILALKIFDHLQNSSIGELYLNSMDRDGTGQGYDFDMLNLLSTNWSLPVIMAGGVGNSGHLLEGLLHPGVDAVATANLFNFVGDGLKQARKAILDKGISLAFWPSFKDLELRNDPISIAND